MSGWLGELETEICFPFRVLYRVDEEGEAQVETLTALSLPEELAITLQMLSAEEQRRLHRSIEREAERNWGEAQAEARG